MKSKSIFTIILIILIIGTLNCAYADPAPEPTKTETYSAIIILLIALVVGYLIDRKIN